MLDSSTEELIFDTALSLSDRAKRAEYLDAACHGNQSLRRRIESLLTAAEDSGNFMRNPAVHALAGDGQRETLCDITTDGSIKPENESLIGQTVGYYRIVARIGSGGMGEVYLAEDTRLGRKVALKIISPEWTANAPHRFVREAQLTSALDHPNVCPIYDIGQTAEWCFISMQYIEGQTLEQLIGTRPLPTETLLTIALQTCDALSAAHHRGIIHRDIKPRNIMFTARGQAIVLDFGLAKLVAPGIPDTLRQEGIVGTPAFMSPEQARGEGIDFRSDIFSFGGVLYYMATSTIPFRGKSTAEVIRSVIAEQPTPPRELNPKIPRKLGEVIDRALSKAPGERYQSAGEMASDLRAIQTLISLLNHPASLNARRQHRLTWLAVVTALLVVAAGWFSWQTMNLTWARRQLPTIENLIEAGRTFEAYHLAVHAGKYLPGDSRLAKLLAATFNTLSVKTQPSGAQVYLTRFNRASTESTPHRIPIGPTPFTRVEIARDDYVITIEKEGYDPFQRTISGISFNGPEKLLSIQLDVALTPAAKAPIGMVFVPGGRPGDEYRLVASNRPTEAKVKLDGYYVDRFEVTNRQFQEFVDAGGYQNKQFWTYQFVKEGQPLSWREGMLELQDNTGQAGPRGWSKGTYPEGKADHPVTGITWYEAAAYAAFRGKQLPTIYQWEKAARDGATSVTGITMPWGPWEGSIAGRANLDGDGTIRVGSLDFGISPFGCYDMAGNVSEWCLNETSAGFFASGGSWASLPQAWGLFGIYPAFRSSAEIGFRCVQNSATAGSDQGGGWIDIEDAVPRYTPAPESDVRTWLTHHYDYDTEAPLDARVQRSEADNWRREKIEFNGAGGERALAYLYLPKHLAGPYQVVHLLPAGDVRERFRTVPQSIEADYTGFLRSGRAIFTVVLRGYLERDMPDDWNDHIPKNTIEYVESKTRHIVDLRRGLDYLETRDDINASQIAFLGSSVGGPMLIQPAVESRYYAVILNGAGIVKSDSLRHRAANPINFVPLIRQPTLLIHGQYDESTPLNIAAMPLYNLLAGQKTKRIHPGGHYDAKFLVQEANSWLNETLGPVKPALANK